MKGVKRYGVIILLMTALAGCAILDYTPCTELVQCTMNKGLGFDCPELEPGTLYVSWGYGSTKVYKTSLVEYPAYVINGRFYPKFMFKEFRR